MQRRAAPRGAPACLSGRERARARGLENDEGGGGWWGTVAELLPLPLLVERVPRGEREGALQRLRARVVAPHWSVLPRAQRLHHGRAALLGAPPEEGLEELVGVHGLRELEGVREGVRRVLPVEVLPRGHEHHPLGHEAQAEPALVAELLDDVQGPVRHGGQIKVLGSELPRKPRRVLLRLEGEDEGARVVVLHGVDALSVGAHVEEQHPGRVQALQGVLPEPRVVRVRGGRPWVRDAVDAPPQEVQVQVRAAREVVPGLGIVLGRGVHAERGAPWPGPGPARRRGSARGERHGARRDARGRHRPRGC
mmetsp:Transcript_1534/g.4861  ORF Transcript_1534/g.4861 Transcript_1534/m.4861 type:complete len:308 (+) Transcript_1534:115-1038(+)